MNRWKALAFSVTGLVAIARSAAVAQAVPDPPGAAAPASIVGPAYGVNDPCPSLAAIIGRPSQTNSVWTVRPGHVLIETGYQNTSTDPSSTTVQYPQTFVRIGTAVPALEVTIGLPVYQRAHAGGASASGFSDIGAGLKYVLGYTSKFNYGTSVFFTAPTGSGGFSAGTGTQAYGVNYGYTINSVLSLAGTFSFNSVSNGSQRYSSTIPSLVLSAALPNATAVFVEAAQFTHGAGPGTATRTQLLGGLTRGLTPRSQVDLELGGSPTSATNAYHFLGFGASYYF